MKGVYTVKRKHGTAVYLSYQPPGEPRVRASAQRRPPLIEGMDPVRRADLLLTPGTET